MTTPCENTLIETLTRNFGRSPLQLNRLQESDAEILCPDPRSSKCLAVTTDSLAEEIATGLYEDPFLVGWMTVMVNMSDLAATGAAPLGILISEVLPPSPSPEWIDALQRGIQSACEACGTFVLGGDTNEGTQFLMTGCAIGMTVKDRLLSRVGVRPGDLLYTTGMLGSGNAFALRRFLDTNQLPVVSESYRPVARLTEGQAIAGLASACMDTSDGALATIDQLARLNGVGFELTAETESIIDADAVNAAAQAGIPPWFLLAGPHGEFELLFTVSPDKEALLLETARHANWEPLRIGHAMRDQEIRLRVHGTAAVIDTGGLRNVAARCGSNVRRYLEELFTIDHLCKEGALGHVNE